MIDYLSPLTRNKSDFLIQNFSSNFDIETIHRSWTKVNNIFFLLKDWNRNILYLICNIFSISKHWSFYILKYSQKMNGFLLQSSINGSSVFYICIFKHAVLFYILLQPRVLSLWWTWVHVKLIVRLFSHIRFIF